MIETIQGQAIKVLSELWLKVLEINNVELNSNFFELGGHSLKALDLIVEIESAFNVQISMKDIIENPTLESLAIVILSLEKEEVVDYQEGEKNLFPLIGNQLHMYNMLTLFPEQTTFNISNVTKINKPLSIDLINKVIKKLFDTNDILKCRIYRSPQREVFFRSVEEYPFVDRFIDLNLADMEETLNKEVSHVYKVEDECLVRIKFYKVDDNHYVFFFMVHHLICDGLSVLQLFREFLETYEVLEQDGVISEHTLKGSFRDYVLEKERFFKSKNYLEQLNSWRDIFSRIESVSRIESDVKGSFSDLSSSVYNFKIEGELLGQCDDFVRAKHISLFNLFLYVYKLAMLEMSEGNTVIVGTPVHGRAGRKYRNSIGNFINTLPVVTSFDVKGSLLENSERMKNSLMESFFNQDIPLPHILKKTDAYKYIANNSLFQTLFSFLDVSKEMKIYERDEFDLVKIDRRSSHTDIDVYFYRSETMIDVVVEYKKSIYSIAKIERLFDAFRSFLKIYLENDQVKIEDLLTNKMNSSPGIIISGEVDNNVPNFLSEICRRIIENPQNLAIEGKGFQLTYGQLADKIKTITYQLKNKGLKEGDVIGVMLHRDVDIVPTMLSIMLNGCTYLPLDLQFPEERLSLMVSKSKARFVICSETIYSKFIPAPILNLKSVKKEIVEDIIPLTNSNQSAYVLFTSGSTGEPKGVEVSISSVSNFLHSMKSRPGFDRKDKLLSVTTISFDISVLELFLPLVCGGSLYLADKNEAIDPIILSEIIKNKDITIMQATPVTWRMLLVGNSEKYLDLKSLCGGEALDPSLKEELLSKTKEVWNMYGPTETTVWSAIYKVDKSSAKVPIGRPILNTQFLILDDEMNLVSANKKGKIYISGSGVAKGYLFNQAMTDQRFISSQLLSGGLIYETGDIGEYDNQGLLYCYGRYDGQVKVRGHRIELGEIESCILKIEDIYEAAIKLINGELYAFVSTQNSRSQELEIKELIHKKIKSDLPAYMMVRNVIILPSLPKTANGKIDRNKLGLPRNIYLRSDLKVDNDIVKTVHGMWIKVFDNPSISITDSFFYIGGHSLMALDLFNQINTYFNLNLNISIIFEHDSVSKLSEIIEENLMKRNKSKSDLKNIVTINEDVNNAFNVFCFHGLGGNVLNYYPLAQAHQQINFYGVQSFGLDGRGTIPNSLEKLSAEYIKQILIVQSSGPFFLAGGSMGGMIALEVANQLKRMGHEVKSVVMFDTYGPNVELESSKSNEKLKTKITEKFVYWKKNIKVLTSQLLNKILCPKLRYHYIEKSHYRMIKKYMPSQYEGPVILIRGKKDKGGIYLNDQLGWEGIFNDNLKMIEINGEHDTFIESNEFLRVFRQILIKTIP